MGSGQVVSDIRKGIDEAKNQLSPDTRFKLRIIFVAVIIVINVVKILDNKDRLPVAMAYMVTSVVLLMCMTVVIMVGPTRDDDPPKVTKTIDKECNTIIVNRGEFDMSNIEGINATSTTNVTGQTFVPVVGGDASGDTLGHSAVSISSETTDCENSNSAIVAIASSRARPTSGYLIIQKHCRLLAALSALGFIATVIAAVYYLQLAISQHEPFSLTTLPDSLYMCPALYLSCSKWFIVIVFLMRKMLKGDIA